MKYDVLYILVEHNFFLMLFKTVSFIFFRLEIFAVLRISIIFPYFVRQKSFKSRLKFSHIRFLFISFCRFFVLACCVARQCRMTVNRHKLMSLWMFI